MSTVLSRVRDKRYWNVVVGIVTNSILLLVFVSQLIAAYLNHRPAYKELEYIAWVVMNAVLLADNIYKLVSLEQKQPSYTVMVGTVFLMSLSLFVIVLLAPILQAYPNLDIHWTFYPRTNH